MVGIQRSKACAGCRARRKKCDEVHPECGLCNKRGIECIYKDDLNIVLVDPGSHSRYGASNRSGSSKSTRSSSTSLQSVATPQDLPQQCLITSYRMQTHGVFLDSYFPGPRNTARLPTSSSPGVSGAWLSTIYKLSLTNDLLSDALSALSLAYIERQDEQDLNLYRSKAMYGRAMRALSRKLNDENEMRQDATLAAAMALTAYELQNASKAGVPGWLSHAKGTSTLIKLRGNRNVDTEFGQQLFLASRLADFINAIGKRRAIEPLTSSFPDTFAGQLSSFAKLFEVLQGIPSILEQGDSIRSSLQNGSAIDKSKLSIMAYTCQDLEARLTSWRAQLDQEHPIGGEMQLCWEEPSMLYHTLPIHSPARVYSTFLCFLDLDIAQQLVLHWTGLLFMQLTQSGIERGLQQHDPSLPSLYSTDADRAAGQAKCWELATNITRSLEYFVHPDMGLTAMDFLGLPINLVFGFFSSRGAQECLWFDVIFNRLSVMSPGFGEFIKAMAYQGGGGKAFQQLVLQQ